MKRIISLILCLAMVMTMIPAQVFATETEKAQYAVTWEYDAAHVTIEGPAVAVEGEAYSATLTEAVCCDVLSFAVRINKVYIDEAKYTYAQSTGVLTISAGLINGDISIEVLSRQKHTEDIRTEEFPGTCMEVSRTDKVVYCVECGVEFSRSSSMGTYGPHEAGTEPGRVEPTCQKEGGTGYYCKYGCGTVVIEEVVEQLPHTPGKPVLAGEWYIRYCIDCGEIAIRELVESVSHTPGEPVLKGEWNVVSCTECGWEISREHASTQREAAEKMLKLVNDLRAEHGLNPLQLTQEAVDLAASISEAIVEHPEALFRLDYCTVGAMSVMCHTDAPVEYLFQYWCSHSESLAAILDASFAELGFGYVPFEYEGEMYSVLLLSAHQDGNRDHVCDRGCEGFVGEHTDSLGDGDHFCDYCQNEQEKLTDCYGGTADCCWQARCEECGHPYGEVDKTNHRETGLVKYDNFDGYHLAKHSCCYEVAEIQKHTYENGRCACDKLEPKGYGYGENFYWELDADGKMTVIGEGAIESGAGWVKHAGAVKELIIVERITAIGEDAFAGFGELEVLSFPATAQVEKNAFFNCRKIRSVTLTGTGEMTNYDETTRVNLPWFCTDAEGVTVTFGAGLTGVGSYAFCGAEKVTSVLMSRGLVRLGDHAFRGSGLKSLSLPDTVTEIGASALSGMKNCVTLELPDSVEALGEGALCDSGFQAVKLPGKLKTISKRLLSGCVQLNTVTIPETVTVIGEEAFLGCKALMGIRIPESVTRIEAGAFRGCAMLYTVTLPENLTEVGANAFAGDTYLVTITIKSTALTVGENAFSGCNALSTVYFSGSQDQWKALNIASGNEALTKAKVHFGTETEKPVQQISILHKSGLQFPADAVLDGKNILVDLAGGNVITLGHAVFPEDATNAEVIWDNNNRTVVDAVANGDGTYTITGKQAGDVTVVVMNYGSSGNHTYANTAVRFQFRKMVLPEGFPTYMTPGEVRKLNVTIEGDAGTERGIVWSMVKDETGEAVLTSDGRLTAGRKTGTVTVRAETTDGSGMALEAAITITDYAVVISGPDQVASGKSITLIAELVPSNLTNTKIIWALKNIDDSKYLTRFEGGKITAKAGQTEKREIVVLACAADGKAAQAEKTVTIMPVAASVAILRSEETVTGTVSVNLNTLNGPLVLKAVTAPADASKAVKWTESSKGSLAALETQGEDTVLVTPTGKTGTVTLTATAADGSGKKATLKVQFVRSATDIHILNNPGVLRAGSKLTLTTDVATAPDLTDRKVVWSLSPESLPYASINAKTGALTTYAYPGQVTIAVRAAVESDQTIFEEQTIVLKPGAAEARISRDGKFLVKNEIVYVTVGTPVTLTGSVLPENAIQGGTWKVSGKGAAVTDNGDGTATVTMNAMGTATAVFTASDGSKKNLSVKIQAVALGGTMTVTANGGATELRSGRPLQLTATVPGATLKKFAWSVDKPEFATVTNGKVKALTVYENTTVTVTATALDGSGLSASYELRLLPAKDRMLHIRRNGEVITGTTQYLVVNGAGQELNVEVYDSISGTWTQVETGLTLGGKALTLNGMTVSGRVEGSGTVTAKQDGLTAKVTFKVVNPVETITLSEKNGVYHLLPGKSLTLKAALFGADGKAPTEKKLTWTVDDPTVATVSASGVVKAAKNLTRKTVVKVTATAIDGSGVSATREITLYPMPTAIMVSANGVVLNQCVREFKVGDTLVLDTEILPGDAMQDVSISISSGKLATMTTDENGNTVLKLTGKGTLTIKVATQDGSKRTVSVKIKIG